MNTVAKAIKNISGNHVLLVVALVALGYALYMYSQDKGAVTDTMTNKDEASGSSDNYEPSQPLGHNEEPASISNVKTTSYGLPPSCKEQTVVDPAELLPHDDNSDWAKLHPAGKDGLQGVNLLKAGYHIGIDTVGQSMRNANLQVRSEPPNPQLNVSPWNNTTIDPTFPRKPFEIGCGEL